MHGFAKVAKKLWPSCFVQENESQGAMDIRDPSSGELLVAARKDGQGRVHCAQAETHAKYPLAVLQSEHNLFLHERYQEAKAGKDKDGMEKFDLNAPRSEEVVKALKDEHARAQAAKVAQAQA